MKAFPGLVRLRAENIYVDDKYGPWARVSAVDDSQYNSMGAILELLLVSNTKRGLEGIDKQHNVDLVGSRRMLEKSAHTPKVLTINTGALELLLPWGLVC